MSGSAKQANRCWQSIVSASDASSGFAALAMMGGNVTANAEGAADAVIGGNVTENPDAAAEAVTGGSAVSYTHLTLPTILLV